MPDKYRVDCDLTDKDGNTGRFENGTVTVAAVDGDAAARLLTKAHFAEQGVMATNIRTSRR